MLILHNGRIIGDARTKEDAIKFAKKRNINSFLLIDERNMKLVERY